MPKATAKAPTTTGAKTNSTKKGNLLDNLLEEVGSKSPKSGAAPKAGSKTTPAPSAAAPKSGSKSGGNKTAAPTTGKGNSKAPAAKAPANKTKAATPARVFGLKGKITLLSVAEKNGDTPKYCITEFRKMMEELSTEAKKRIRYNGIGKNQTFCLTVSIKNKPTQIEAWYYQGSWYKQIGSAEPIECSLEGAKRHLESHLKYSDATLA